MRLALILLLSLLGPAAIAAPDAKLVTQGQALLDKNCSRCHAIGATGDSSHAQAPPFRVVARKYPPASLAEALAEGIVSGHPDMPEFTFEPSEIEAIIAYLETLGR